MQVRRNLYRPLPVPSSFEVSQQNPGPRLGNPYGSREEVVKKMASDYVEKGNKKCQRCRRHPGKRGCFLVGVPVDCEFQTTFGTNAMQLACSYDVNALRALTHFPTEHAREKTKKNDVTYVSIPLARSASATKLRVRAFS